MDSKTFEESVRRLVEVNKVITELDPAIRADAFSLLKPYISTGTPASLGGQHGGAVTSEAGASDDAIDMTMAEEFFTTHEDGKPAGNAYLCVAYLYSQYGANAFSMDDVRAVAEQAGLTLPERVDVTLGGAKKNGKPLFKRAGRGKLQPNVHGETYLKSTYGITRGTKARSD